MFGHHFLINSNKEHAGWLNIPQSVNCVDTLWLREGVRDVTRSYVVDVVVDRFLEAENAFFKPRR